MIPCAVILDVLRWFPTIMFLQVTPKAVTANCNRQYERNIAAARKARKNYVERKKIKRGWKNIEQKIDTNKAE